MLLDIDGVLTVSWEPIAGAADALAWLLAHDIEFRLVTNTSSVPRREIARLLTSAGMDVDVDHILTAVTSAARYLREHHGGARCLVLNDGNSDEDLEGVDLTTDPRAAGVVLMGGAGPDIDYERFDAVFKLVDAGTPVIALHRNVRYHTAQGAALDMGAFIVGLEAATGVDIGVVGKPAADFWQAALTELGVTAAGTVMVGDDIDSDVLGAQVFGLTGVLVRTGKFRPSDLERAGDQPDHVIDDITQLPALLAEMA